VIVFWIIAFIIVAAYVLLISLFYFGWISIPEPSVTGENKLLVSVIIPVRNEQDNIGNLLNDLVQQEYPKDSFEVIVIDDHSTDHTFEVISVYTNQELKVRYIRLEDDVKGKKQALFRGVNESKYSVILTTDADCRIGPRWIITMVDCFYNSKADFVAGPVILHGNNSFFYKFQQLEILSLIGSAAGAIKSGNPVMCSAANMGFRKSAYLEARNARYDRLTSGDDVFLLLSLHKTGKYNIVYLKNTDSFVSARAEASLSGFINQRRRWASKSRHYFTPVAVFTAIIVFLINIYAVLCLFAGLISPAFLGISVFIFIGKTLIDFPFLYSLTGYFRKRKLLYYFPAIQFLYFFYISFTAISAFMYNFEWKGRTFKN
jgi:cellulose synthase/poly-beta-1,6-N-acetylglucosamine synthase-like glycosyltransferase